MFSRSFSHFNLVLQALPVSSSSPRLAIIPLQSFNTSFGSLLEWKDKCSLFCCRVNYWSILLVVNGLTSWQAYDSHWSRYLIGFFFCWGVLGFLMILDNWSYRWTHVLVSSQCGMFLLLELTKFLGQGNWVFLGKNPFFLNKTIYFYYQGGFVIRRGSLIF